MTKDEMAEEYAKGLCKTCKVDVCRHSTIQTCAIKESLKQAHLAGLKAGKDMAEADLATVAYMHFFCFSMRHCLAMINSSRRTAYPWS